MGTEDEINKRRLMMSKIFANNHINSEKQRAENFNEIAKMAPNWLQEDLDHFHDFDKHLTDYQFEIQNKSRNFLQNSGFYQYYLSHVDDVLPVYSFQLISNIGNIKRFKNPEDLLAFFGMHNYEVDTLKGKRWFPTRQLATDFVQSVVEKDMNFKDKENTTGFLEEIQSRLYTYCTWGAEIKIKKIAAKSSPKKLMTWSRLLRDLCWRIGESIRKGNGFYHHEYSKIAFEKMRNLQSADEADIRILELQSARHVTKFFLRHVFQYWSQFEGRYAKAPPEGKERYKEFPGLPFIYAEEINNPNLKNTN